ncbi:hypothetical protein EES41_37185 (plasmid) [Streptomyces sp. ADI95-16]|uniref:hypothetical protein n=1 Tax=Streptomyces sp. ADI95-16 TaxID=1522758 RepID=UPI000F437C25|nr:hypothetical protein [Streptomyces sp. ADI95-16]AYV32398.1 hypothetical protein EES41_37185 [Streptomyces sp. ADI95-16]
MLRAAEHEWELHPSVRPVLEALVSGARLTFGELAAPMQDGAVDRFRLLVGELLQIGNACWLSLRIRAFCRSTACAMPGSTRDDGAARRCASIARR